MGLSTNDKITVENLLYGLMMVSGNDAAIALGEFFSGSIENFANVMNNKAAAIGLKSTHFTSPHGLDNNNHYTTAYELALISNYALKNELFCKIVNTKKYSVVINGKQKLLSNTNELLGYIDGVYGIKTGFTNGANRCLVTSCKRGNLDIICVVLGCDTKKNRSIDSIKLINYAFENFESINIKELINKNFSNWKDENINSFNIVKGYNKNLELSLNESQFPYEKIAINKKYLNNIETNFNIDFNHFAPLEKNEILGKIDVFINSNYKFSIDILNDAIIEKKNISYYLKFFLQNYIYFLKFDSQ